ncbi:MAG: M15 family metallopeptidase [Minisyncoccota bacterium]
MSLDEELAGKEIPNEIRTSLVIVSVAHFSFDKEVREGRLIVHAEIAEEVQNIFKELLEMRFPIAQIIPVSTYGWDDDASMAANNTSAFNYRNIFGTNRLSNHSYGRAIDINPIQNPYTQSDGAVVPHDAQYDPTQPGTITADVASIFKSYGWEWGGDWQERKDWQHFERP